MKKVFLSILFTLILVSSAWSATYYVDATLGLDANPGTEAEPWQTTDKVVNTATDNDVIYFKCGETWTGVFMYPQGSTITYGKYGTGNKPILIGNGANATIQVNSRSNIIIQDLDIRNAAANGIYVFNAFDVSDHNTIRRCKITITGTSGDAHGIYVIPNAFTIHGLTIDSNEIASVSGGSGINVYNYDLPLYDPVIRNNNIHDVAGDAIYFQGQWAGASATSSHYGIDIDSNTFTDIGRSAINVMAGFRYVEAHPNYIRRNIATNIGSVTAANVNAFQLRWVRSTTIENNIIDTVLTSVPDGDGIYLDWWNDVDHLSDSNIVRYNSITGCNASAARTAGISMVGTNNHISYNKLSGNQIGIALYTAMPTGNVFYNNTLNGNAAYGALLTDGSLGLGNVPASTWKNNILSNAEYGFYIQTGSTVPTETYNLFYGNSTGNKYLNGTGEQALGAGNVTDDPLFVSTSNLSLQAGSPAIDGGTNVSLVLDILSNTVPLGAAQDIGAYERTGPWYIANAGSDSAVGGGQDIAAPWQTIAKVNAAAFQGGSQVLFNRGDTWREQLTVPSSGSAGLPITFGAYGTGEKPIINGSDVLTGFAQTTSWQSIGVPTVSLNYDTGDTVNSRLTIPANTSSYSGTKIRLTGHASAGTNMTIAGGSIGVSTANDDFDNDPAGWTVDQGVRITWDTGSAGTTITAGVPKVSDEITFNFDKTKRYLLTLYTVTGQRHTLRSAAGGTASYYNIGAVPDDTLTQTVAYSAATYWHCFDPVEVLVTTPNVYQVALVTEPTAVWFDGIAGAKQANLAACDAEHDWFWEANVLYIYHTGDPSVSHAVESGARANNIYILAKDYIVIDNLDLRHTGISTQGAGINIGGGTGFVDITDCNFSQSGDAHVGIWGAIPEDGVFLLDGNTFDYSGLAHREGAGNSVNVTGTEHNTFTVTFQHNTFSHYGNYTGAASHDHGVYFNDGVAIVRYNLFEDGGAESGAGFKIAGNAKNGTQIYYNIFTKGSGTQAWGILTEAGSGHTAYNNIFYGVGLGVWQNTGGGGITFKNNIFHTTTYRFMVATVTTNFVSDNNDFYGGSATPFTWEAAAKNLADWKTASSQDVNSLSSDPLFVNAAGGDFHLLPISPAINAGVDVGLTSDYEGNPISVVPDMGAYEYIPGSGGKIIRRSRGFWKYWDWEFKEENL